MCGQSASTDHISTQAELYRAIGVLDQLDELAHAAALDFMETCDTCPEVSTDELWVDTQLGGCSRAEIGRLAGVIVGRTQQVN